MDLARVTRLAAELRQKLEELEKRRQQEEAIPVLGALRRAAEAMIDESIRRGGGTDFLRIAESFTGLVVAAAIARSQAEKENDQVRDAFLMLGASALVKSRNQGARWRRESEALAKLLLALEPARAADGGQSEAAVSSQATLPFEAPAANGAVEATELQ